MSLQERLEAVRARIVRACDSVQRDPAGVTLVAVTKTVPIEKVQEAYDLGVRTFGENKVQEGVPKVLALPSDIEWHFVGRLQSNKAKKAAQHFHVIHTLDNVDQLVQIERSGTTVDGLIQLNLANEQQKAGISEKALDKSIALVQQYGCVRFRGLMTIGPQSPDPEGNRALFRRMAELGREVGAEWLSMGMSADLEAAIQEGSTHVRVGSAIFGERQ